MSELIVDFPQQYYNNISEKGAEKDRVQFLSTCTVVSFERYSKNEAKVIWYKSGDYREMRVDTRWAALEVNFLLRYPNINGNLKDILDETVVGIEHLLHSSIIRKSMLRKAQCICSVLEEQSRPRQANQVDDNMCGRSWELLARESRSYSEQGINRARKVGLLHRFASQDEV